jgi:hypothetical protein
MKIAATLLCLSGACATTPSSTPPPADPPAAPALPPQINLYPGRWIEGFEYSSSVLWADPNPVGDPLGEDSPPGQGSFTVVEMSCIGCRLTLDPTGKTFAWDETAPFKFFATTDSDVLIGAKLQWINGYVASGTAKQAGDREVAVTAKCFQASPAEVADFNWSRCGATRRADQNVFLEPLITTKRNYDLGVGCVAGNWCGEGEEPSPDVFTLQGAPYHWQDASMMLDAIDGISSVTLSAKLVTGEVVTSEIKIPPVAPPS